MRHSFLFGVLLVVGACQLQACPSPAGGSCDPRNANCPTGYHCAKVEICTKACEQPSDCWVKTSDGCRSNLLPGQRLADGGVYVEQSEDGFCPETKSLRCEGGYCQPASCPQGQLDDGGCDYDPYGPSPFKGNRDRGPDS